MNHCCAICRDGLSENPAEFNIDLKSCPLNVILGTPCRHVFHCYCLAKWLEFQEEATIAPSCPACRHPVPLIDFQGNVRKPKYVDVILIRIGDSNMIATTLDTALALITLQMNRSLEANTLEFKQAMQKRQSEFEADEKRHRSKFETVVRKWETDFRSWEVEEQRRNESSRLAGARFHQSYHQSGANDTFYMLRKTKIREERRKFDREVDTVKRDFNLNARKRAANFEAWKKDCKDKNERQRTEFIEAVLNFQRELARSSF